MSRNQIIARKLTSSRNLIVILILLFTAFIGNLLLIANPGYFSHDELQKLDHVKRYGLNHFLVAYTTSLVGKTFATPVRPIGFAHQGIVSVWMDNWPVLVHLLDVLIHLGVAALLLVVLRRFGLSLRVAVLASALFLISPLTVLSTGWVGASMDRWYTLFILAILIILTGLSVAANLSKLQASLVVLFTSLAILSKETALVLPILVGVTSILVNFKKCLPLRRLIASNARVIGLTALPIIGYLIVRYPAINATLGGGEVSAYKPSLAFVLPNIFAFFAFPFMPSVGELQNIWLASRGELVFGFLAHTGLLIFLVWLAGWRWLYIYLFAYFICLLLVLNLPNVNSHYLYFSAIPLSVLIATMFEAVWMRRCHWFPRAGVVILITAYLFHTLLFQIFVYRIGLCQERVENTFLAVLAETQLKDQSLRSFLILPAPGTLDYVAKRTFHDRPDFHALGPLTIEVGSTDDAVPSRAVPLVMDTACRISRKVLAR